MKKKIRKPTLIEALIPIVFLIVSLSFNVAIFGDTSLDGSNQIILLLSAAVAGLVGIRLGYRWEDLRSGAVESISSAMVAILILLLIGSLSGTWLLSGIVPAMIYYGLTILNPSIFLVAACIISSIVSLATGSSWSTVATIGIALLGIGKTLGMSDGLVAGAIISGAYFGDKISPLSDTTNLAPAMAGTDLFTHIRYMLYTTIPSLLITLIIFLVIGFSIDTQSAIGGIEEVQNAITTSFHITPWLFVVPVIVVTLIVRQMPALPALLMGTLLGGLAAIIFQPQVIEQIGGQGGAVGYYSAVMKAMFGTISIKTSNEMVNGLLSSKGMAGMLKTIWLIICSMTFGGIMEKAGFLERISRAVISGANSAASLISTTVGTCIFFNLTASDQYLAIVVPGRMYAQTFREKGLKPENLSRSLEDAGTVTSVLIPWNTCGATQASVLGVATFVYFPYCFFNIISPIMSIIFAVFNIRIARLPKEELNSEQ